MWLQVLAFGVHLSTSAQAAAGASSEETFFGIICTANGLASIPLGGQETPATLESDCAICSLTALHNLSIANHVQTFERPVHVIRAVVWPVSLSDGPLSLSPRVGTSRAPPLV